LAGWGSGAQECWALLQLIPRVVGALVVAEEEEEKREMEGIVDRAHCEEV